MQDKQPSHEDIAKQSKIDNAMDQENDREAYDHDEMFIGRLDMTERH